MSHEQFWRLRHARARVHPHTNTHIHTHTHTRTCIVCFCTKLVALSRGKHCVIMPILGNARNGTAHVHTCWDGVVCCVILCTQCTMPLASGTLIAPQCQSATTRGTMPHCITTIFALCLCMNPCLCNDGEQCAPHSQMSVGMS